MSFSELLTFVPMLFHACGKEIRLNVFSAGLKAPVIQTLFSLLLQEVTEVCSLCFLMPTPEKIISEERN
ncbi:hypothetical protein EXN66_Car000389 [Channa argus]|uniref:Uncharacterized protein n=1 Tax=Channa argus TaxID=215402 RepID=A0A6G1QYR3_CHAAH|nr:hypothetical protein EXN66_Car000389 [Channa argus]